VQKKLKEDVKNLLQIFKDALNFLNGKNRGHKAMNIDFLYTIFDSFKKEVTDERKKLSISKK
jgi:hypothetical protein